MWPSAGPGRANRGNGAGERERKSLEPLLVNPVPRYVIVIGNGDEAERIEVTGASQIVVNTLETNVNWSSGLEDDEIVRKLAKKTEKIGDKSRFLQIFAWNKTKKTP